MSIDAQKSTLRAKLNELESNYELYKEEVMKKDRTGQYIIKDEPLRETRELPESIYDIPLHKLSGLLDRMYINLKKGKTTKQELQIVVAFLKATEKKEYVYLANLLEEISKDSKQTLHRETNKVIRKNLSNTKINIMKKKDVKTINKELEQIKKRVKKIDKKAQKFKRKYKAVNSLYKYNLSSLYSELINYLISKEGYDLSKMDEYRLEMYVKDFVYENQEEVIELLKKQEYLKPIMQDEQIRKDLKRR